MAKSQSRIGITIVPMMTQNDAVALIILATAATFAAENEELFKEWCEKTGKEKMPEGEEMYPIDAETLMATVQWVINKTPDDIMMLPR